jgi:hypothetical protein
MPEWMRLAVDNGEPVPPPELIVTRMAIATLCGLAVAALYRFTLGHGRKDLRTLPTTLVLLSLLIAVVTLVIGNNVARAFGLVGALSIVRFRTVVEDTGDTAFVIFAVTLGMAVGSGYVVMAAIALPAVAAATVFMGFFDRRPRAGGGPVVLAVRCGSDRDPAALLAPVFAAHTTAHKLTAVESGAKGKELEAKFAVRLSPGTGLVPLLHAVLATEGVLGAELKQPG